MVRGAEFMSIDGDAALKINDYYDTPGAREHLTVSSLSTRNARSPKYAKSGLSDEQMARYKRLLEKQMTDEDAYLQPDLTLPVLAEQVGCSANHLSQVINAGFGMSFFEYLSKHRIEHAKELLAQPDETGGAVLNVAFGCWFQFQLRFLLRIPQVGGHDPHPVPCGDCQQGQGLNLSL